MFKSLISLILVFGFQISEARSLAPRCAPVVDAQPSRLSCVKEMLVKQADGKEQVERVFYSIIINTKMSGPACTSDEHLEVHRADVSVSINGVGQLANIQLSPGTFEYTLGGANAGSFSAPVLGLELNDCVSPLNGGFSIGN